MAEIFRSSGYDIQRSGPHYPGLGEASATLTCKCGDQVTAEGLTIEQATMRLLTRALPDHVRHDITAHTLFGA